MYGCSQGMLAVISLIQVMCCWMLLCTLYSNFMFQLAIFLMQGSVGAMMFVDGVKIAQKIVVKLVTFQV